MDFIANNWILEYLQRPIYVWNKLSKRIMAKCRVDYNDDSLHIAFSLGPNKDGHYEPIDYIQHLNQIQHQSLFVNKETYKSHNAFDPLKHGTHKGFEKPLQNSNKENLVQLTKKFYWTNEHDPTLTKILNENDELSIVNILSLFNTSCKTNINLVQLNHMNVLKKKKLNNMNKEIFQSNDSTSTLSSKSKSCFEIISNIGENVEVPTQNSKTKKQKKYTQ